MPIFSDPDNLLASVTHAAGGALRYQKEVRDIIAAALPNQFARLAALAFKAKFLVRTAAVLKRIPPRDESRKSVQQTFQEELENAKRELVFFYTLHPTPDLFQFEENFFTPTIESFTALLNLLHDLSWIQNLHLDNEHNDGS